MGQNYSSYRSAVKSTALIGGAQVIQIFVSILRAKIIAVLIGSAGMGMNALLQSAIVLIQQLSGLGVSQSAVREISQASVDGNNMNISRKVSVFKILMLISGVLGTLICLIASPWLSKFLFASPDYTWAFAAVSISILFATLAGGNATIMQATRNLSYLAKASVLGVILSLVMAIPLFYFLGINGVVPAVVAGYLSIYIANWYYARKIKFDKVESLIPAEIFSEAKPMVKLGFVLMISGLMMALMSLALNGFISRIGGVSDVGFYQAASNICMQGMTVVNAVLVSDYFPRLSAICNNPVQTKKTINQQAELIILILGPLSALLIIFAPIVVRILLSSEFIIILPMLRWMSLALIFRGVWLALSYVILARGDKWTYLIYDALIGNGLGFVFNIAAYYFWGLKGLGISYVAGSVFMVVVLYTIIKKKYNYNFNTEFTKLFIILIAVLLAVFLADFILSGVWYYIAVTLLSAFIIAYSYNKLDKRINLTRFVKDKIKKPHDL